MQLVLQEAEIKIKDIENIPCLDVGKLQGELQAKPPSYTVVKKALHKLQDIYVKRKREDIKAVVREALLKRTVLRTHRRIQ